MPLITTVKGIFFGQLPIPHRLLLAHFPRLFYFTSAQSGQGIMDTAYIDVVFPIPIDQPFTYRVPPALQQNAQIGCRVLAPFGRRRLTGFIIDLKAESDLNEADIRDILDVLDAEPLFSKEILDLARWMARYYLCPLGEALRATIPAVFLTTSRQLIAPLTADPEEKAKRLQKNAPRQAQILRYIAKSGTLSVNALKKRIGSTSLHSSIHQLCHQGLVRLELGLSPLARPKFRKHVRLLGKDLETNGALEPLEKTSPRQAACLRHLLQTQGPVPQADLMRQTGITSSSLKSLEKSGFIEVVDLEVSREYYIDAAQTPPALILNQEQEAALNALTGAIEAEQFEAFLLHGITGSGKTQVYIEAIHKVLARGRDAIVLVPEIALTPQIVQRFRAHFKEKVAVLHSGMSDGERYDAWRKLRDGEARVAIGARSAVFAPLQNLGLIVVDEEQESSYKQSDRPPRYHARDVAILRARNANAAAVLGSATPSTESYYNALTGKYRLLELTRRIDDVPLPHVKIVDMSKEKRILGRKEEAIFSRELLKKMQEKIANGEQIILLLNRRGFANFIKCKDCGHVETCEQCNIALTYHIRGHVLRCHYCNFCKRAPRLCANCQGVDILFRGLGTQRVEENLREKLPEARTVRMDLDTTGRKHAHDRILQKFERGHYDILLGTQMIAKGLDFYRVTLVGVINADIGLLIPDFRANERTFQLLTQVAGRAGRKHLPGEVIIQTYSPETHCLLCAKEHDFKRFYHGEIATREGLRYPPFGRLVSILFRGRDEARVMQAAKNYAHLVLAQRAPFQVLGPTPAPILKIQNLYRWQLILKSDRGGDPNGKYVRAAARRAGRLFKEHYKSRGVKISVDVDPQTLI